MTIEIVNILNYMIMKMRLGDLCGMQGKCNMRKKLNASVNMLETI